MKKLLFIAAMLLSISSTFAQTTYKWDGNPGVAFKVKRCYVINSQCIIDFVMTNNTGTDIPSIYCTGATAYDDEGNKYEWISGSISQKSNFGGGLFGIGNGTISVPNDIAVKGQIIIPKIDEFAVEIRSLILGFYVPGWNNTLDVRNIPITRDN